MNKFYGVIDENRGVLVRVTSELSLAIKTESVLAKARVDSIAASSPQQAAKRIATEALVYIDENCFS